MTQTMHSTFDPPPPGERLTVEQYHRMIETGILEEGSPLELLDGSVVRKDRAALGEGAMTVGIDHILIVTRLAALDPRFHPYGCHVRTQQPILLPPFDEPEPDAAVIAGGIEDYAQRKPEAADVLAVIEVADSSLGRDRSTKLKIYAKAGLPLYFIINLPERCIEQYTQPLPAAGRYGESITFNPRQSIVVPLPKRKSLKFGVASLLP